MPPPSTTGKSATDVFGAKYADIPQNRSLFSSGFDKLESVVQKSVDSTQGSQLILNQVQQPLTDIGKDLLSMTSGEPAGKNILIPIQKIIDGLDSLKSLHPAIGAAIVLFTTVVKFEIMRRENDKKILGLILQISEMMAVLLQLKGIKDPNLLTPEGVLVDGPIQALMPQINTQIRQCGATIYTYRKESFPLRFIKAPIWNATLLQASQGLIGYTAKLDSALTKHIAGVTDRIDTRTASMQDQLDAIQAQQGLIYKKLFESQSREEMEVEKKLKKQGLGRDTFTADRAKQKQVVALITKEYSGLPDDARAAEAKQFTRDPTLDHALETSPADLIMENFAMYNRRLEDQITNLEKSIERAEQATKESADLIIKRIDSGPHERVRHPVVKHVWGDMKWRSTIKARTFVLALHDFYLDQAVRRPPSVSETDSAVIQDELVHDPNDDWCLQYLTIPHVPAIMEAFDDDASGWIKLKEVNEFTDAIPEKWKLIHWLAYWAAGWRAEVIILSRRIATILSSMVEASRDVLVGNSATVLSYLNNWSLGHVQSLTRMSGEASSVIDDRLQQLVNQRTEMCLTLWEDGLKRGKFEIETEDALTEISEGHRVEAFIFPILFVLLRHHLRIMRLAVTKPLSELELQTAAQSVENVMVQVINRKTKLEEAFRQQRLSPDRHVKYFAAGIFTNVASDFYHAPPPKTDESTGDPSHYVTYEPFDYSEAEEDVKSRRKEAELNDDQLKFKGVPPLETEAYSTEFPTIDSFYSDSFDCLSELRGGPVDATMSPTKRIFLKAAQAALLLERDRISRRKWTTMKKRRDLRIEFISIQTKIKEAQEASDNNAAFPTPSDEEYQRNYELYQQIDQRDLSFYESQISRPFLSTHTLHVGVQCDACGLAPIGIRLRCVQCSDFDLCSTCFPDTPDVFNSGNLTHRKNHSMMKLAWPTPEGVVQQYKARAVDVMGRKHVAPIKGVKKCNECSTDPPIGRFRCAQCDDFDLCEACEKANLGVNDVHKADHDLLKIHWELPKFPDGKTVTEISWSLETARDPTSFADVDHSSPGPIAAAAESIPACPVGGVPSTETKVVDSPAEHTEKDSEHQEKPPQGRRLYCHGGCGRTDLSVIHVCLECPEVFLCPDCDTNFTKGYKNQPRETLELENSLEQVSLLLDKLGWTYYDLQESLNNSVALFLSVVALEVKLGDADRTNPWILVVILRLAIMMTVPAKYTFALPDATGSGKIEPLVKPLEKIIEQCGRDIYSYQKEKVVFKYLNGPIWDAKLVSLTKQIDAIKIQLANILDPIAIEAQLSIDDSITETQEALELSLADVLAYRSPDEPEWARTLDKLGGREACLADPSKLSSFEELFPTTSIGYGPTRNHRPRHVVLIATDPDTSLQATLASDQSALIVQLRQEVLTRLGVVETGFNTLESRLSEIENRFTGIEGFLARLAVHMGMPNGEKS